MFGSGSSGGGGATVTFADTEIKKRERKTGDRLLPAFQESEEHEDDYHPVKKMSDSLDNCSDILHSKSDMSPLSPLLSEPIMIPGDQLSVTLSPSESQKNLSRSFEESRPRSLEMETEKDSNNSKG